MKHISDEDFKTYTIEVAEAALTIDRLLKEKASKPQLLTDTECEIFRTLANVTFTIQRVLREK